MKWTYYETGSLEDGASASWLAYFPSGLQDAAVIETTVNGSGEISFWSRYALSGYNQGTVTFWWKTEVLDCCGEVHFLVDGEERADLSQTTDWLQAAIEIPKPGVHNLLWNYEQHFYPDPVRGDQPLFSGFSRVTA